MTYNFSAGISFLFPLKVRKGLKKKVLFLIQRNNMRSPANANNEIFKRKRRAPVAGLWDDDVHSTWFLESDGAILASMQLEVLTKTQVPFLPPLCRNKDPSKHIATPKGKIQNVQKQRQRLAANGSQRRDKGLACLLHLKCLIWQSV